MRELSDGGLSDDVLKSFWFQRLPPECQQILVVSSEDMDKVAEMADKICEVSLLKVCGVSKEKNFESNDNNDFLCKFDLMLKRLDKLDKQFSQLSRSRSQSRSQSQRRSSTPSTSSGQLNRLCWYHKKYADMATKCRPPCSFDSKSEN